MNILIITQEFPPVGAGVSTVAYSLSKYLIKYGHNISVLTCQFGMAAPYNYENKIDISVVKGFQMKGGNIQILTYLSLLIFGYQKGIQIIKKKNIDVIICFMTLPAGLLGMFLNIKTKVPFITSLQGSDVPHHSSSKIIILLKTLIRIIWQQSNMVVAGSQHLRDLANRTYCKAESEFKVVYNGLEIVIANSVKIKNKSSKYNLLTVARLYKLKGIQDVLRALHHLRNQDLVDNFVYNVVGTGPYEEELKALVIKYNLVDNVNITGYVDKDILTSYYTSSDFFILTSHNEAMGMVLLEALSYNLPIIGSNIGGIPEIVDSNIGILVEKDNYIEIAQAILDMSSSLNEYKKEKLQKKLKFFSISRMGDGYTNIAKNLIKKRFN
ncbi:MAG: glycosyltransferase family 4 protein [Bacteroidetes bacterium]|jgi:glycosyltransferase involved in cell wall biosynthesis|nr:glycosyltransferase family 4 protein [Bacteroidota bacterium]